MGQWKHYKEVSFDKIYQNDDGKYDSDMVDRWIQFKMLKELEALNALLSCPNFVQIPKTLREIKRNTTKPKRKKLRIAK